MASDLYGTNLEKGKGEDEFLAVEELIKETLAESKRQAPPPPKEEPKIAVTATPIPPSPATPISHPATPLPQPSKPAPSTTPPAETGAGEYEHTFKEYKVGDIVKGKVLKVDPSGVLVDINYKADGLILPEELSDKTFSSPEEVVKVGSSIAVCIENLENKEGYVVLSKKNADYEMRWKRAYDAYKSQQLIEGRVVQVLKGGLVIDCEGLRGFIPASQVAKKAQETLESFQGRTLPVKIIEVNHRQGKIVLSHKLAAGDKEKFQAAKLLDELEVGQVRHGTVCSIKSFGAFVDIGGIEGLIHLSELSWKRVKHPSEMVKMGQELDVFVLGVDKTHKKVALGLKELQPDPWVDAKKYFKAGQVVKVKVLRFAKFGAFVELDHGLEGLVHISELAKDPVQEPGEAVKIGAVVEAKILRVLPEEQRIGLSIREVLLDKEKAEQKANTPPPAEEKKVTIADMIAQKEKERAEEAAEETEEVEEESKEEAKVIASEEPSPVSAAPAEVIEFQLEPASATPSITEVPVEKNPSAPSQEPSA